MERSALILAGSTPGLRADAAILSAALQGHVDCTSLFLDASNRWQRRARWARTLRQMLGSAPAPLVCMESLYPGWMATSRVNVLVPNLEWMYPDTAALIGRCSGIWCKSRDAQQRLARKGLQADYLGFASRDRHDPDTPKDYARPLHLAGRSELKGTRAVLAAWQAHPEWPTLTLVARPDVVPADYEPPANVEWVREHLDDQQVTALMNRCGIHLCPSEAEGFGHYIGEALACKSVVVTTDAAPMNEHFGPGEGLLVPWAQAEPLGWGERYRVTPAALAETFSALLLMPLDARAAMGERARQRYLGNRLQFESRARELARQLHPGLR